MAKAHCFDDAAVFPVKIELDGATPIVPMRAVVLQLPAPQTTDEWAIPSAPISLAFHPDLARRLAHDLLAAAENLDHS